MKIISETMFVPVYTMDPRGTKAPHPHAYQSELIVEVSGEHCRAVEETDLVEYRYADHDCLAAFLREALRHKIMHAIEEKIFGEAAS